MDIRVETERHVRGRAPGRLGPGLTLDGEITAGEDVVFAGRLNGSLSAPSHAVTIAEEANVRGRVFGRIVLVEGTVRGEVTATHLIDVAESAKVEGDLSAPAIAIAQGAFVTGRVDMRRADAAARVARYRLDKASAGV